MILEMDVGNTVTKWRLLGESGVAIERGSHASSAGFPKDRLSGVTRIRIASVAGSGMRQALREDLGGHFGVQPEFAETVLSAAGVYNSYAEPSRMGVDRWLALLAAWSRVKGPVVVVDAGTAITVDALDAGGRHAGGYIMPGLQLLAASLQSGTREVNARPLPGEDIGPGMSTDSCVSHGVRLMAVAAILRAVTECQAKAGNGTVLLCGGDVAIMQSQFPVAWRHVPELVLDGLAFALP
ncbi:MAG: type III pantothenate kinase [Gammaproteobacteria bacterium]|nr:MAG: type III pantothenate kinase [Gammaproteobacteria bacterium]